MKISGDLLDEIQIAVWACDSDRIAELERVHPTVPVALIANLLNEGGGRIFTDAELLARIRRF